MGQGKKSKAKARLDKYWSLAHQEGFRARSAYKLTQLNKKYGFLNRASTVVDLCAAPGGWLQVCQQVMPVTSTIVGVDLYPIKAIPGVKTLVGDITTDKTKKELLRELGGKKAEVVLHDGAPSVGGTWDKDAYVQNVLVLHAARFACQVLQPEGVFVTKVFRSVDYTKLLYVFEAHFEKVEATKPPSSRNTSAEIFVVCRGYKCPKTLDNKFFDPKYVFEEISADAGEVRVGMEHGDQGGYEDEIAVGGMRLHGEIPVSAFVRAKEPEKYLESMGSITFKLPEDAVYMKNKHTNPEIVECCKDLKVLNKTDKVRLLKWRHSLWQDTRSLRAQLEREAAADMEASDAESEGDEGEAANTEEPGVDRETAEINKMKSELDKIQKQKAKQQKKKERKQVNSILQRAQRTNFNPDDDPLNVIATQDKEMFKGLTAEALKARDLEVANADMDVDHVSLASDAQSIMSLGEGSDAGSESDMGSVAGDETGESSYYQRLDRLLDHAYKEERYLKLGHREEDPEPDDDVASVASSRGRDEDTIAALGKGAKWEDSESEMSDASYLDSDDSLDDRPQKKRKDDNGDGRTSKSHKKIGFEEVPKMLCDPENRARVLAIGTRMLDKGNRRDIIEAGINRWSFNDDGLPKWFLEDEKKHHYIPLPVTKEEVDAERARYKEINARPARKVLEAMHRKYQRAKRTVAKASEGAKAAGGETLRKKHIPTVREVLRSKDMRNSHKKKKPLDPKTIGDKKREKHKLAQAGRGKRKRNH